MGSDHPSYVLTVLFGWGEGGREGISASLHCCTLLYTVSKNVLWPRAPPRSQLGARMIWENGVMGGKGEWWEGVGTPGQSSSPVSSVGPSHRIGCVDTARNECETAWHACNHLVHCTLDTVFCFCNAFTLFFFTPWNKYLHYQHLRCLFATASCIYHKFGGRFRGICLGNKVHWLQIKHLFVEANKKA